MVVVVCKYSSSEIIDFHQLSSAHDILSTTKLKKTKTTKTTPPTTIDHNCYCCKLSPISA